MSTLYAPIGYNRSESCTCGPNAFMKKYKIDFVPDKIYGLSIKESCCIHDYMYLVGQTEDDRKQADRVFLNNMLRTIDENTKSKWLKWLRKRRAYTYYQAVVWFGGPNFWDGKNESQNLVMAS